ncbi:DUF1771-domain-containing protein [Cystobasidium minutum MCA 4210]|uniref:DUF1771-domain-containing protein n=1 Tax=Cystobasidium minutum MCA 4210 TaxID=1397322 RepID=UPI0034CD1885|eukprot:jgi/Rhomi1/10647/CE10646_1063
MCSPQVGRTLCDDVACLYTYLPIRFIDRPTTDPSQLPLCLVKMSSSGIPIGQIISLAKRFLFPQVSKWLKERKKKKQQQQQQQSHQQQASSNYQQQPHQGGYNQQGPPPQQYYQGQPPQQQGYHNNNQSYQPHQGGSYAGAAASSGGEANAFYGAPQTGGYNQPESSYQQGVQGYSGQQYGSPQHGGMSQSYGNGAPQQYKPPHHINVDSQNASDPHYVSLRNQALREDDLMGQAFDAASAAYKSGDGARAKELSNEGKMHQRRKEELNDQAADFIFAANNRNQPRGSIDLHGLYVQEAIERTERAVQDAQSQGLDELRIITGKGIHSNQGIAKIKPAIEKLMVKYNLAAHLDPHNTGVLIVSLSGPRGGSRDLGWVDQADRESDEGQCVIM